MNILVFKGWRWLSPKGEVTEGVRAGEVRRVAPFQQGEDVVDNFAESHIRGDVGLGMFLHELSFGVHREYPVQRHSHLLVRVHISWSVSKSSIEGFCVREKQVFDVCQTLDFKLLWLLFDHFPVQGGEEAARAEQQRALGQHRATLVDPVQVAPRHVCHANGPRRAV